MSDPSGRSIFGDSSTGDSFTGDSSTGDSSTGDSSTGDSPSEESSTEDSYTGDSHSEDSISNNDPTPSADPGAVRFDAAGLDAAGLDAVKPGAVKPGAVKPDAVKPDAAEYVVVATAILRAGDTNLLLEFATLEAAMSAHTDLLESPVTGQVDAIAGARTVLLRFASAQFAVVARGQLARRVFPLHQPTSEREVVIDVVYDGEDLAAVAAHAHMSEEAIVAWHTSQAWLGAFPGFAGFTYCVLRDAGAGNRGAGGAGALHVPRRPIPRTSVPAGSVGLAGEFSGIYPREAPGGWQLIGRTGVKLWDLSRSAPSLIRPWDTVRYRQVRPEPITLAEPDDASGLEGLADSVGSANDAYTSDRLDRAGAPGFVQGDAGDPGDAGNAGGPGDAGRPGDVGDPGDAAHAESTGPDNWRATSAAALEILSPGLQSLIEDEGRPGVAHLGVSRAGVMDRAAALAANRAVGNPQGAAVIENLFGGFRARALRPVTLAVAGAEVAVTVSKPARDSRQSDGSVGGSARKTIGDPTRDSALNGDQTNQTRTVPLCLPFELRTGEIVELGVPTAGVRATIAIRGGIAAESVLGSVSTDTLSGIGPAPLSVGALIQVAEPVPPAAPVPAAESAFPTETATPAAHVRPAEPVFPTATAPPAAQVPAAEPAPSAPEPQPALRPTTTTPPDVPVTLRVVFGPRDDWFDDAEKRRFLEQRWIVSPQSNRVGIRFLLDAESSTARPLERSREGELLSEGMAIGSLQVPHSGIPVLLMNDQGITGGYPIIAVVISEDLSKAAQLYPGQAVRFVAS